MQVAAQWEHWCYPVTRWSLSAMLGLTQVAPVNHVFLAHQLLMAVKEPVRCRAPQLLAQTTGVTDISKLSVIIQ